MYEGYNPKDLKLDVMIGNLGILNAILEDRRLGVDMEFRLTN